MSDGSRLRQSWQAALNDAQNHFRGLLVSSSSASWKRVPVPPKVANIASLSPEDNIEVVIHRKTSANGDIMRAVLDLPVNEKGFIPMDMQPWKAVLTTPEMRQEWDPSVEAAHLVEMFDPTTRIAKTNFTLGWPANPRDAITISRTFCDANTLIDVSTSLPRSPDEPAYLRPAPPFVRSHVHLFAWCVQLLNSPNATTTTTDSPTSPQTSKQLPSPPSPTISKKLPAPPPPSPPKIRITCFWQHNLKVAGWGFGSSSGISSHLSALLVGLVKAVRQKGPRIPLVLGYGLGVGIENISFDPGRDALTLDYHITEEEEDDLSKSQLTGMDELRALKEQRRLERALELSLPASAGWDIQITTRASTEQINSLPWTASASLPALCDPAIEPLLFSIKHSPLPNKHAVLKVKVVIEFVGEDAALRLNGSVHAVQIVEERDPSHSMSRQMLQDAATVGDLSFQSASSAASAPSVPEAVSRRLSLLRNGAERTLSADKSVQALVRRNYVYFASLLQEPEAKWKALAELRGVTVNQLDSIDPTLVVYRAEAVFVGVGLWDLFSAVATPGAKIYWDKTHDDSVLLEDVNELTDLWHVRSKPVWPVAARDSVLLKTSYKSPTAIHVFSFSTDDPHLFTEIPPSDPAVIRTQVDLRGWSIESLSPTTTMLTLIEQSDPKGWSNKSSIPQQMIANLAGVGEFAIKCGGPPIATRLGGARMSTNRYDHERGVFRIEYKGNDARRVPMSPPTEANRSITDLKAEAAASTPPPRPFIECEIRCDLDTWAPSLDVVVDPPPQAVSVLRRHRLSESGGGVWITIEHDAVFVGEDRLVVIVRKGTAAGKEKGSVVVNGAKVKVDIQEIPDQEIKALIRRKRVKPVRIPLDQPPVLNVIRKRREQWASGVDDPLTPDKDGSKSKGPTSPATAGGPKGFSYSPWTKYFSTAVEQATNTAAALTSTSSTPPLSIPSAEKLPINNALDALSYLRVLHSQPTDTPDDSWTLVSDTAGLAIHRKMEPDISSTIPVHRGVKIIEGVTAEEVAHAVTMLECRKQWDDRFDQAVRFEEYGFGAYTEFIVNKGGFPFRDRGFYVASIVARIANSGTPSASATDVPAKNSNRSSALGRATTVIFCASASYNPELTPNFAQSKYNPYTLPIGRVLIQGWILETLDPYTAENYSIPSTRVTAVCAVDYSGNAPVAYNTMLNLAVPKSIPALETFLKTSEGAPLPLVRMPPAMLAVSSQGVTGVLGPDGVEEGWDIQDPPPAAVTTRPRAASVATVTPASTPQREADVRLVASRYTVQTRKYRAKLLVAPLRLPSVRPREEPSGEPDPIAQDDDRTPTASRIISGTTKASGSTTTAGGSLTSSGEGGAGPGTSTGTGLPTGTRNDLPSSVPALAGSGSPRPPHATLVSSSGGAPIDVAGFIRHQRQVSGRNASPARPATPSRPLSMSGMSMFGSMFGGGSGTSSPAPPSRPETPVRKSYLGWSVVPDASGPSSTVASVGGSPAKLDSLPVPTPAPAPSGATETSSSTVTLNPKSIRRTVAGEVLISEVVVDSRMYPEGFEILLAAVFRTSSTPKQGSKDMRPNGVHPPAANGQAAATSDIVLSPIPRADKPLLPFTTRVYSLPASPFSAPSARYLVQVCLSRAGEAQQAKAAEVGSSKDTTAASSSEPKVPWYKELAKGGAVVEVVVRPVVGGGGGKGKARDYVVFVEGKKVDVDPADASLATGDEDKRTPRLVRVPLVKNTPSIPSRLAKPLGIARQFLSEEAIAAPAPPTLPADPTTTNPPSDPLVALKRDVKSELGAVADSSKPGTPAPNGTVSGTTTTSWGSPSGWTALPWNATTGNGAWNLRAAAPAMKFLNTYPQSLRRMGSGLLGAGGAESKDGSEIDPASKPEVPVTSDGRDPDSEIGPKSVEGGEVEGVGGARGELRGNSDLRSETGASGRTRWMVNGANGAYYYTGWMVLAIAIISFLLGSLVRSLLSPADFVYVGGREDWRGEEDTWREVRRLVEVKYIVGGWDFLVAVVRRH